MEDLAKGFKNIGSEEAQQEENKEIKKEEDSDQEDI